MRKNLIPAAILTGVVALVTVGCGDSQGWEPSDLSQAGAITALTCDESQQAIDIVSMALDQRDPEALSALGVTESNKASIQDKLTAHKAGACGEGSAAAPVKGTGTPAPWPCPENMAQHPDPNRQGNLSSVRIEDTEPLLALAGRDARALGAYASHPDLRFLQNPDPRPLVTPDSTCLSQEGQNVWNQMKGALTAGSTKKEDIEAPATWHNTAMVRGQFVVDSQPGIGGDRSALAYTLRNGGKFIVMKRCANPVLPAPGNLPQGPTDHQRPPGLPPVTPPDRRCTDCESSPPPRHPVCPPSMPHGTPPNCKDGPDRMPNYGPGPGRNTDPGSGVYIPPGEMDRPSGNPRVDPAPPTAAPPAAPPRVTPPAQPTPQPTVDPGTQPPNHGTVDPNPGGGQPCNPDFQNC